MQLALEEARKAFSLNEVPIGCVIVKEGEVIAKSYNKKTIENIATYHAEILAIEQACRKLNTWYLEDCVLYTTVEPCMMCTGAIMQSRISKVVYGTRNDAFGAIDELQNSRVIIVSEILKTECQSILSKFFRDKREKSSC